MCTGCTGKIACAAMPGFICEQGKCVSFLGVFGNTKSGGRQDFDSRPSRFIFLAGAGGQGSSELRHDERIAGAATGDNELVDLYFAQDEAMKGVDDGER